jgi:hypothetical protein
VTIVRELIAAGVPKHMRVDAEGRSYQGAE